MGTNGKVYSEEIADDKVKGLKKAAGEKNLVQVLPVLGKNDDPGLPADSVDMAFMHYVYHHFSQPREMLAAGFCLLSEQPAPAADRMLLVFGHEQTSGQP